MVTARNLDLWIEKGLNVLFIGKHGVGKTTIVREAFHRNNLKYLYFSSSTMDPWVDFIGIPREIKDGEGEPYLDLVRPKPFRDDAVQAIFFDEFNRAPKKVRNAVMELLQFKSINGRQFQNLKIIWAAINPDDENDSYDIEPLDPAQKDRFHIHVTIPYKCNFEYFQKKYSKEIANAAISWWNKLPKKMNELCSPRRLDYALEVHFAGGNMRDVLHPSLNVNELVSLLQHGSVEDLLKQTYESKDVARAKRFLCDMNYISSSLPLIMANPNYVDFFLPLVSHENLAAFLSKNSKLLKIVLSKANHPSIQNLIQDTLANSNSIFLKGKIKKALNQIIAKNENIEGATQLQERIFGPDKFASQPYYNTSSPYTNKWKSFISLLEKTYTNKTGTYYKVKIMKLIVQNIPKTLNKNEILETLEFLNNRVFSQINTSTIEKEPLIINVINHCLIELKASVGQEWHEILQDYANVYLKYIIKKIVNTKWESRFILPI